MLTINDLNITRKCWEWIIKHTEEFEYIRDDNFKHMKKSDCIKSKETSKEFYVKSALKNIQHKRYYDAIAYQAIDGINKIETDRKISEAFRNNKLYAIIVFNLHNDHTEYYAFIGKYDKITTARFAALKWIWEQVNKKE